jgi:hypothetical protein
MKAVDGPEAGPHHGPSMARRGRKKQFETEAFVPHSFQLPKEVALALEEYCHEKRKWKTQVLRERLEELLEKEGYLKVMSAATPTDARSGPTSRFAPAASPPPGGDPGSGLHPGATRRGRLRWISRSPPEVTFDLPASQTFERPSE